VTLDGCNQLATASDDDTADDDAAASAASFCIPNQHRFLPGSPSNPPPPNIDVLSMLCDVCFVRVSVMCEVMKTIQFTWLMNAQ
jgi:hypothetical protein